MPNNNVLTDERINELALLNLGYARTLRMHDFARAIEREVLAANPPQPVAGEPRNVEGMTRAEFERHLRVCFQHDNVRAQERGIGPKWNGQVGITQDQEREIAERVEQNYPSDAYDYSPRCPGCAAFDSEASHVDFVQGCEGCKARMQKIAGFGPLWRANPPQPVADDAAVRGDERAALQSIIDQGRSANPKHLGGYGENMVYLTPLMYDALARAAAAQAGAAQPRGWIVSFEDGASQFVTRQDFIDTLRERGIKFEIEALFAGAPPNAGATLTDEQSSAIDAVCKTLTPTQIVNLGEHIQALRSIQWQSRTAVAQTLALLTDERIMEALTIPGLNIEASLEPRELAHLFNGIRALLASHPTNQPEPRGEVVDDRIGRLREAIEGECDGLHVDYAHARAILEYVDGDAARAGESR